MIHRYPPFELERYFAQYEFTARYLLSSSDLRDLDGAGPPGPRGTNVSADDRWIECAQQELGGKVIPLAGAKAGSRIPVAVPVWSGRSGEAALS